MTAPTTAEEWGRLAVSLPGWRWVRGMHDTDARTFIEYADCGEAQWLWAADDGCEHLPVDGRLPDPDDPATAGCLLAMLGGEAFSLWASDHFDSRNIGIGRACIAYAAALGRWPEGHSET